MSILDQLLPQSERHTVHSDPMDEKTFNDLRTQSESLQKAESAGTEVLKTFLPLTQDIWSSLFKFNPEFRKPEEMSPGYRFNATLMEKMTQMQQYKELRVHTRLDDMHSAIATVCLAEELTKKLKEELKDQVEQANKVQDLQEQLQKLIAAAQTYAEMAAKSGAGNDGSQLQDKADQFTAKARQCSAKLAEAETKLSQSCSASANTVRAGIRAATEAALKNAQSVSEAMDGWGIGGGEFQRMPIEHKLKLAKKLQSAKFKKMVLAIGRIRRLAVHKQKTKLNQARDEIHTVGTGNDLSRVLPIELAQLRIPTGKREFERKFIEGKLMQYELKGTEKQGKGPVIVCCDNSGSMAGDREIWSKAVALALLEIATMQKRRFACIHFGGPPDALKTIEIEVNDKEMIRKAVEVAEYFVNAGGTDFEKPLKKAAEHVGAQKFRKADIVFITDGQAPVSQEFLVAFLGTKKQKDFKVFSVLIQSRNTETLRKFSDEIIEVSQLLDAEAEPLLEI